LTIVAAYSSEVNFTKNYTLLYLYLYVTHVNTRQLLTIGWMPGGRLSELFCAV